MKKTLKILSSIVLTILVSTTIIACNNKDTKQIEIIPILNETLAKLEQETAFNPYNWTKDTLDETVKSDFLSYLQKHMKNFNQASVINLKISRVNLWNQIVIVINYQDKGQKIAQIYFIKTGISLEGVTNNAEAFNPTFN